MIAENQFLATIRSGPMYSQTLENNVKNVWAEKGKMWLRHLPSIIASLSTYWALSDVKPVRNMSYNYVARAIQKGSKPVVLKISCDKQLIENEHIALNYFDGEGSIRAIDTNKKNNALLLEQAIPGSLLKAHYPANIADIINVYGGVVNKIASRSLASDNYTHVSKWCNAIDRIVKGRIENHLIEKAKELKEFLLNSAKKKYLCHGDLHLENIICNKNQWLSIDPKGIIGEKTFEAAAFDLIGKKEWNTPNEIKNKISKRVNLLAKELEIDKDRLLAWTFLRAMIAAQWSIEDNGNPGEMLQRARPIYSLI